MEKTYKTQAEYNTQYAQFCAEMGDHMIKIENANAHIMGLKAKIADLAKEAKEAADAEKVTTTVHP